MQRNSLHKCLGKSSKKFLESHLGVALWISSRSLFSNSSSDSFRNFSSDVLRYSFLLRIPQKFHQGLTQKFFRRFSSSQVLLPQNFMLSFFKQYLKKFAQKFLQWFPQRFTCEFLSGFLLAIFRNAFLKEFPQKILQGLLHNLLYWYF